ncbi:hypothetical protein EDB92DRAFT_576050 [Lactarius akahatsu]|uniref:Uncharacterized protein n=1 Tax=Lactarius akahatsu TaxID=416441 RepID=A0AAD4LI87_9AGAM|nr:hypothetical protein EDB92DRAFT_576050 [Lactarius akahatsu]
MRGRLLSGRAHSFFFLFKLGRALIFRYHDLASFCLRVDAYCRHSGPFLVRLAQRLLPMFAWGLDLDSHGRSSGMVFHEVMVRISVPWVKPWMLVWCNGLGLIAFSTCGGIPCAFQGAFARVRVSLILYFHYVYQWFPRRVWLCSTV